MLLSEGKSNNRARPYRQEQDSGPNHVERVVGELTSNQPIAVQQMREGSILCMFQTGDKILNSLLFNIAHCNKFAKQNITNNRQSSPLLETPTVIEVASSS